VLQSRLGIRHHGADLPAPEGLPAATDTNVAEEGATTVEGDEDGQEKQQRENNREQEQGYNNIETALS
jgi:hypothetical protein